MKEKSNKITFSKRERHRKFTLKKQAKNAKIAVFLVFF